MAATLVEARTTSITEAWEATGDLRPGTPVPTIVRAVVAALRRCEGTAGGRHVHAGSAALFADLEDDVAGLDAAAVTSLREVLRREILNELDAPVALDALLCTSVVLDDLLTAVTEQLARRSRDLAYVDELTRLGNRRAAMESLDRSFATATRHGRALSVVVIDVDGLKAVNDTAGHDAGDALLRDLAGALQRGLRDGDAAFRTGGDEFLVLLPETDATAVDAVLARVVGSGAPAFSYGAADVSEASSGAALVHLADQRLLAGRRDRRSVLLPVVSPAPPLHRRRWSTAVALLLGVLAFLVLLANGAEAGEYVAFGGWALAGMFVVRTAPVWSVWRPVAALATSGALVAGSFVARAPTEPAEPPLAAPPTFPAPMQPSPTTLLPLPSPTTTVAPPPATTAPPTTTAPAAVVTTTPSVTVPVTTPVVTRPPLTVPRPKPTPTTTTSTTSTTSTTAPPRSTGPGKHLGWRNNHQDRLGSSAS